MTKETDELVEKNAETRARRAKMSEATKKLAAQFLALGASFLEIKDAFEDAASRMRSSHESKRRVMLRMNGKAKP